MKRVRALGLVLCGMLCGLIGGAMLTAVYGDQIMIDYSRPIAKAGETTITRGELAEEAIARVGADLLKADMRERAIVNEAARRANVTVTADEVAQRVKDTYAFAEDTATRKRLEKTPRPVLERQLRSWMLVEKMLNLTVTDDDARAFYSKHPDVFVHPAMVKLVLVKLPTYAKATEAAKRIRAGEDPRRLSEMYSNDPELQKIRGDLGWRVRSGLSSDVADKIFGANDGAGLKRGECTDVITVRTPDTEKANVEHVDYLVFYVDDLQKAYAPKFEEVRAAALYYARGGKLIELSPAWYAKQAKEISWKQADDLTDPQSALIDLPFGATENN